MNAEVFTNEIFLFVDDRTVAITIYECYAFLCEYFKYAFANVLYIIRLIIEQWVKYFYSLY